MRNFRGILLAAGSSSRFGSNKLLHRLRDGTPVAVASARNLLAALPETLAVVRPDSPQLETLLREAGCRVIVCPNADEGMGVSLAHAISASRRAHGWVIALGDMPFIRPQTIRSVLEMLESGAVIVAPACHGERGHPVGFSDALRDDLLALRGDEGARSLLKRRSASIHLVEVDDPGIVRDIDTPEDVA